MSICGQVSRHDGNVSVRDICRSRHSIEHLTKPRCAAISAAETSSRPVSSCSIIANSFGVGRARETHNRNSNFEMKYWRIKREYENRKESKAHTAVRRVNSCRKQFIYKLKQFHVSFDLVFSQCAIYEQFAAIYMKKKTDSIHKFSLSPPPMREKKGKMKMYKTHKNWEASQRTCKQAWWRETTAKREMQKKIILKHRETDLNSALPSAHYREGKVRARKRDI